MFLNQILRKYKTKVTLLNQISFKKLAVNRFGKKKKEKLWYLFPLFKFIQNNTQLHTQTNQSDRLLLQRDMVFRGDTVMSVAHLSAEIFQRLRWIPPSDRIRSGEMLQLVCCFPLQELGQFVLWFWNYICLPPPEILYFDDDLDNDDVYGSSSSSSIVNRHNYYHLRLEWRKFRIFWFFFSFHLYRVFFFLYLFRKIIVVFFSGVTWDCWISSQSLFIENQGFLSIWWLHYSLRLHRFRSQMSLCWCITCV